MIRDYGFFRIIHGNIAEFRGGAIVVPCFSDLTPAPEISDAVRTKLSRDGYKTDIFGNIEKNLGELFTSEFYPFELPFVKGLVMARCYVDRQDSNEKSKDMIYYLKTAKTAESALSAARKNDLDSIAFPVLMAGRSGGSLGEIVPAMIDEISRAREDFSKIEIYALNKEVFREFVSIADVKLR